MKPEREKWWNSLPPKERAIREEIKDNKETISYIKSILNDKELISKKKVDVSNELKYMAYYKTIISALKKQLPRPTYTKYLERDGEKILISSKCLCKYKKLDKSWKYCPYCGHKVIQPTETTLAEKELNKAVQQYLDEKYEGEKFNIICEPKRKK